MSILKEILVKRKFKKSRKGVEKSKTKKIKARSSRVGVEFRIPSKRIFNGKEYRTFDWKISKSAAEKIAEKQCEEGYKARTAEQYNTNGRKGWAVYIRK